MIVACRASIRVLVIKLADRLHNARTWGFVPAGPAQGQGDAGDLRPSRTGGIQTAARARGPLLHGAAAEALRRDQPCASATQREDFVRRHRGRPRGQHREDQGDVQGPKLLDLPEDDRARPRLRQIYDLTGIRVLVGASHAAPARSRALDADPAASGHIATPKFNLYQSLHHGDRAGGARSNQIRTHECTSGPVRRRRALEKGARAGRRRKPVAPTSPSSRITVQGTRPAVPRLAALRIGAKGLVTPQGR